MRIGSLFSGGGGLDLAVKALWPDAELAWVAENDKHASALLDHHFGVPNLGDLREVDWTQVEPVDVLVGGYPCQPWSHAGKRKGFDDERDGWPWFRDAIGALRPRLVLLENVAGHLAGGAVRTVGDLAALGYDTRWSTVRASDVGAPHKRARWFCVAYPGERGWDGWASREEPRLAGRDGVPAERGEGAGEPAGSHGTAAYPAEQGQGVGGGLLVGDAPADVDASAGDRQATGRAAADASIYGRSEGRTRSGQRAGTGGQSASDRTVAADPDLAGLEGRRRSGVVGADERAAGTDSVAAPAYPSGERHGGGQDAGEVGRLDRRDEGATRQRQRSRPVAGDRSATAAADSEGNEQRQPSEPRPLRPEPRDGVAWGDYGPAIARWEAIIGRPAPRPTDDQGRLSPPFVEWMMGWPDGWVTDAGLARTQQLKILGNGVVPRQAAHAYQLLLEDTR